MASITVPCPKIALPINGVASNSLQKQRITFPRSSNANSLSFGSTFSAFEVPERKQSTGGKIRAQLNEVSADTSSNSAPLVNNSLKGKDESAESNVSDASAISSFMTQVSDLVKLVDSRDIVELELKQLDCELIIRKKEALQQPAPAAPVITMQAPYPQGVFPPLPPPPPPSAPAVALAPAASPPPPASASPAPAKAATSSHPPLKCPMAGTFYRAPGPGEPPFVKVGDKVQKGQVVCIIEAMKLMNEIEADQSGTIVEVLAEDGKPVSVDQPLFVIAP